MKKTIILLLVFLAGCGSDESQPVNPLQKEMRLKNLTLAAIDSGQLVQASEYLFELEALLPKEASVFANQGVVAIRKNELDVAAKLLSKANELKPNNPEIAILRSQTLALQGKYKEAAKVLDAPIIMGDGDNIHLWWASAELNRGNDKNLILDASQILQVAPKNIVARLMLVKASLGEGELDWAKEHLLVLNFQKVIQGETAKTLFQNALEQIEAGNANAAKAQVIGLDNVLKPTRAWQHSLLEIAGPPGTIGHPVRHFLNVAEPKQTAPIDKIPTFSIVPDSVVENVDHAVMLVESPEHSQLVISRGSTINALRDTNGFVEVGSTIEFLVPIDWNNDRLLDVAIGTNDGSVIIFEQGEPNWRLLALVSGEGSSIQNLTAWDADLDGDLDLLISSDNTFLLQNNGDETATLLQLDAPLLTDAIIIDFDEDGDVDIAAIDEGNNLVILKNERSGNIRPISVFLKNTYMKQLTAGDVNNDGWMDLAWIGNDGAAYHGINREGESFEILRVGGKGNGIRLFDSNNSGWLETLVIGDVLQLISNNGHKESIPTTGEVQIVDADLDGHLDLIVTNGTSSVWYQKNISNNNYQKVILEAILKGGQRNNALGVGGFIEVRSGGKYQKRMITGPMTHIGLGKDAADVIRVVWPNGVPQDVVDPKPNQVFTEVQILKGSCPFLATKQNGGWAFVTDLLWRSPLGLKINAQTVPPIAATQDWVKVSSEQLKAEDDMYELAITAQLWETHFIDEVKMIAIDHPTGTDIFVDERFVAPVPPDYQLYAYDDLQQPVAATDHNGVDVLETISERDGRRVGGFTKGSYQGIAEQHFVEIGLGDVDVQQSFDIIASGWIRPTDTSINVASSQGNHPIPKALEVSVADGEGGWRVVIPNAGFPAGKLKTIILELPPNTLNSIEPRIRIATNLEIYWDQIQFAVGNQHINVNEVPIQLIRAELGYMGYPEMSRTNPDAPNIPNYNNIRHHPAWRDLEGFYTRYGPVGELLDVIDDRYVIMNAGDVMYLGFEALKPPPLGMTRDFIFFCDGWVKDGDWNTVDSRTVGPLPHHNMSDYPYPQEETPAELLPSHPDWIEYHTRFISPSAFRDALK